MKRIFHLIAAATLMLIGFVAHELKTNQPDYSVTYWICISISVFLVGQPAIETWVKRFEK